MNQINKDLATSSEAVIMTNSNANQNSQVRAPTSMKEQTLMLNTEARESKSQFQMSQNYQNRMNDKGFLDFDDLL